MGLFGTGEEIWCEPWGYLASGERYAMGARKVIPISSLDKLDKAIRKAQDALDKKVIYRHKKHRRKYA